MPKTTNLARQRAEGEGGVMLYMTRLTQRWTLSQGFELFYTAIVPPANMFAAHIQRLCWSTAVYSLYSK